MSLGSQVRVLLSFWLSLSAAIAAVNFSGDLRPLFRTGSLCDYLIRSAGYICSEHTIHTEDGYILALQRVSSPFKEPGLPVGPPVLLQHGLFMAGDCWFLNSREQSLGYVLADSGFDVWVANVRGTRWSPGHVTLSKKDKEYWDWSWEELALCDLKEMIRYVHLTTKSKIYLVGHSQGTIMSLAALTQPSVLDSVKAAALLSPITYLGHVSAPLVLRMVRMPIDKMILALGIHQLNFRSKVGVRIMDSLCDGHLECNDLLTSITGKNCCFNNSRVDLYLEYEPHPSSSKNLNHLFQMIRDDTFAKYDYGPLKNLKLYGSVNPPVFNISIIPDLLPIWMAYGGNDALADIMDVKRTLKELQCKPKLVYLENYGHLDFLISVTANQDLYENMIGFLRSREMDSSM